MSSSRHSDRRRRRRARPLTVVGIVLLVLGLGCLGWVTYQFLGTNLVAQQAYSQEKDGLRSQWEQQTSAPTRTASPAGSATAADPSAATPIGTSTGTTPTTGTTINEKPDLANVVPGDALALLRIPAFGPRYEVPVLAGTDLATLSRGVGHYASTALPGQVGNFAVAGHRVTHGQPFKRLLELDKGDEIIVETQDATYTYVLDEAPKSLTVKASASWVLDPVPGEEGATPTRALLTLTTCQDLFHSPDRSIGFAHLASTKNKG